MKRGEVYESWINSFGFGTVLLIVFIVLVFLTMAGVIL